MVTADPLSTAVIVLALLALARKRDLLAACLLVASILVRSDNIVLVESSLSWMIWRKHIRFSLGALCGALSLPQPHGQPPGGLFGWRIIMQHGFIKPVIEPITHPVLISFAGYFHALAGLRAIPYTFMTIWIFVAAAVWKRLP